MQAASQLFLGQRGDERVVALRVRAVGTRLVGAGSASHNRQRCPRCASASISAPLTAKLAR